MLKSVVRDIVADCYLSETNEMYLYELLTSKTRTLIAAEKNVSDGAVAFAQRLICDKLGVDGRLGIMAYVIKRMEEKANEHQR